MPYWDRGKDAVSHATVGAWWATAGYPHVKSLKVIYIYHVRQKYVDRIDVYDMFSIIFDSN
jgi:hypothetical protein